MREGVLFEITKDQLETGLRGVPAGYCVTSSVDPVKGLAYVGRPISELGNANPIEIIYLLYFGEAGTRDQVKKFQADLNARAQCRPETLEHIEALPHAGHPMDVFSAALLIAGVPLVIAFVVNEMLVRRPWAHVSVLFSRNIGLGLI